jgi:anti-anti-sigma regulatory factor
MLRITTHNEPKRLTFQLEGSLAGPWVKEFSDCWDGVRARHEGGEVRVDLSAVMYVDAAGKNLLAAMHAQGAEFVCSGCMMRALVAEITRTTGCSCGEGPSRSPSVRP